MGLCVICDTDVGTVIGGYIIGKDDDGIDVFLCDTCKSIMNQHISQEPIQKSTTPGQTAPNITSTIPSIERTFEPAPVILSPMDNFSTPTNTIGQSKTVEPQIVVFFKFSVISLLVSTLFLMDKSILNSFIPFMIFIVLLLASYGRITTKEPRWLGVYSSLALLVVFLINLESAHTIFVNNHDSKFGNEEAPVRLVIWLYYIVPVIFTISISKIAIGIYTALDDSNAVKVNTYLLPATFLISSSNMILYNFFIEFGAPYQDLGVCGLGLVLLLIFTSIGDSFHVNYGWIKSGGQTRSAVFFWLKD